MGSDLTGVYVYIALPGARARPGNRLLRAGEAGMETKLKRRRLEAAELELAQILQLLETPDVKTLMANHSDRQHLFYRVFGNL